MLKEKKGFFSFLKSFGKAATVASEQTASTDPISELRPPVHAYTASEAPLNTPADPEVINFIKEHLSQILDQSGFKTELRFIREDAAHVSVDIITDNDTGRIIGKEGANLDALQILIRASVMKKFGTAVKITLDTGDYQKKKPIRSNRSRSRQPRTSPKPDNQSN